MVGGTRLYYNDCLVAALEADSTAGMTFGPQEVSIWTAAGDEPQYFIDPVVPASAVVNGEAQAVSMLPWPHRAHCSFPLRETRSPANDSLVALGDTLHAYTSRVILRDWTGAPITGWPKERLSFDVSGCVRDTTGNQAYANSDANASTRVISPCSCRPI